MCALLMKTIDAYLKRLSEPRKYDTIAILPQANIYDIVLLRFQRPLSVIPKPRFL